MSPRPVNRLSENAQCPVLRLRTSNHAVGPGDFRSTGPRASRAARIASRSSSRPAHEPSASARQRAPRAHDPLRRDARWTDRPPCTRTPRGIATRRCRRPPTRASGRRRRRAAPPASAGRTRARPARRTCRRSPTTGQADRQRPHSMQSSNRSYASIPSGASRRRREFARSRRGVRRREALDERRHVDDQVGHHGEVRHGLDGHPARIEVRQARHAREALAPVHPHAAGPARCVQARVPDRERRVAVDLDPSERVQDRASPSPRPTSNVVEPRTARPLARNRKTRKRCGVAIMRRSRRRAAAAPCLAVRHGSSTPSLRQTTSAQTSAIPRSVVPLPPVIVTKPSAPPSAAWSIVLNVRDSSRPRVRLAA